MRFGKKRKDGLRTVAIETVGDALAIVQSLKQKLMPHTPQELITEITERIVILYANHSGRESDNRAYFRNDVEEVLRSAFTRLQAERDREWIDAIRKMPIPTNQATDTRLEEIVEMITSKLKS